MRALYVRFIKDNARFIKDNAGVTAIEYGLIAALVAVVCISAWKLLGTSLSSTFSSIAGSV
jgi:pilus assembly protein Flp/PilA